MYFDHVIRIITLIRSADELVSEAEEHLKNVREKLPQPMRPLSHDSECTKRYRKIYMGERRAAE